MVHYLRNHYNYDIVGGIPFYLYPQFYPLIITYIPNSSENSYPQLCHIIPVKYVKYLPQLFTAMSVISLISQWSSSYPLLSPAAYRSFPGLSALTPRGELDAGPLHRGCGGRHHWAARAERGAGVSSASGGENSSHEVDVAIDIIYIYVLIVSYCILWNNYCHWTVIVQIYAYLAYFCRCN